METPNQAASENLSEAERTLRIRTLNDTFRATFVGGQVMMTAGIQSLGAMSIQDITHAIQTFDDFTADNDPHGEHDFGSLLHQGRKVFWKIDYYDTSLTYGSEDPSDSEVTARVLTVMLAEEY